MVKKKSYEMHIVSHTHWDREWRLPFQAFRMKLVDCLDHLLELMRTDPEYKYFTLDGQASLIEDYLEIRPEKGEEIRALVKGGRLLLGPWYTLVDESLVHGESIVRNLLLGHGIACELGGVMKIGYAISSFGHIGQLPQILRGFDIDTAVFSRGINEWQVKSEFIWEAPDGSEVLAFHLPDDYTKSNWFYVVYRPAIIGMPADCWRYEWGTLGLPFHTCDAESLNHFYRLLEPTLRYNPGEVVERVERLKRETAANATTKYLLFMDGVDHLEPNPLLGRMIADMRKRLKGGDRLIHSTLPRYAAKVKRSAKQLQRVRGEMRTTTREGVHNPLLASVLSARMDLKIKNQRVQTVLLKWAEPMACVGWLLGRPYPQRYLEIAWRHLMQNHAHDSICGCSIDTVHEHMNFRFSESEIIAEELVQRTFWDLVPKIDNSRLAEDEMALTVFNSLPFARAETLTVGIDFPEDWKARNVCITDLSGRELPTQLVSIEKLCPEMLMVHFHAADVPPIGYTTFIAKPLAQHYKRHTGSLVRGPNRMENDFLRIAIDADGTISITDKATGQAYEKLHVFEDGGEVGDAWKHIPPMSDEIITSRGCLVKIALLEDGPVLARYRIEYTLTLPECAVPPKPKMIVEEAEPFWSRRSPALKPYHISTTVTLGKYGRAIYCATRIENTVKDHRLRVLFPSGISEARTSVAEGQFDVVERPIRLPDTSGWKEQAYSTHPQLGFVDVSDGKVGLAILNEGLPEYAVLDDAQRTIALTLLRCVGRSIGEDYEQTGGQLLGVHEFRYAIYPHAGRWDTAGVFEQSLAHTTRMKATQSRRSKPGRLPQRQSFFEVMPSTLVLSALKKGESGRSLIVRIYNPTRRKISGTLRFPFKPLKKARITNLLERPVERLEILDPQRLSLIVPAKRIVTVELSF
jgi:mannosylglycerate hydrolase